MSRAHSLSQATIADSRACLSKIHVTKIEAPGPEDGDRPVVHFEGISRSLDSSWDDNANSDIRDGCEDDSVELRRHRHRHHHHHYGHDEVEGNPLSIFQVNSEDEEDQYDYEMDEDEEEDEEEHAGSEVVEEEMIDLMEAVAEQEARNEDEEDEET
ncbi:hypothetical protein N0V93_007242 [Gnomoniopsis smithogilvyi]|uniref:Uncharacterized protein n=1 Tax=Gnomoniopsis smithogilvyi TaxID=1191159 RepID=A0A9W8YQ49_9PEZI|nr:hypothetical protein N0V93_007242 [Gnomoniopsis smithogilvyi]